MITKKWGSQYFLISLFRWDWTHSGWCGQTLISLFKWDSCPIYLRRTIYLLLGIIWMMLTKHHSFLDWWVHFEKYKRALLSRSSFKNLGALPKITSLFIILMKLTPIQDSDYSLLKRQEYIIQGPSREIH